MMLPGPNGYPYTRLPSMKEAREAGQRAALSRGIVNFVMAVFVRIPGTTPAIMLTSVSDARDELERRLNEPREMMGVAPWKP